MNYWNGLVMLVSVGTLLYITTMHMLPEVYGHHGDLHHHHYSLEPSSPDKASEALL
jgi:hypothetical protein